MARERPTPATTVEDCDREIARIDRSMEALQTLLHLKAGDTITAEQLTDLLFLDEYHRHEEDTAINHFSNGYEAGRVAAVGADVAKLIQDRDDARSEAAVANAMSSAREYHAFRLGAQVCREMMARFLEQGGQVISAASVRANWRPSWGDDPGAPGEKVYQTAAPVEISCKSKPVEA